MRTLLVLIAATLLACGTSSPAPTDLQSSPDLATCTLLKVYSSSNAGCNACAEARCCVEINGCFADAACDDRYVNCILACALSPGADGGTPSQAEIKACEDTCARDEPTGKREYDQAIACADARCASECQ